MIERSKLIFNLTYGELIDGLREDLLQNHLPAYAAAGSSPVEDAPTFNGRVLYSLPEAESAFHVSHKTMCQWKKTWMAPACRQEGRKCMCDYDYAIILMDRRNKLKE